MQQRLREEVREAINLGVDPNWSKLTNLPLLDGIMNETLRLHPPVPSGMARETPKTGVQIGPYWIPGKTMVAVPTYSIQRDERYFAKPNEWIPERWFSQDDLIIDRHAWIPFSVGPFNCAGKYFAIMEMKVLIAKAVSSFDVQMAPGEDGKDLMDNCKDYMTLWLPTLKLCLVPLEKS
jgi:cytochrome P450